ncbi:MAG: recombinase family protein [Eubacterium sp.]|nr:recombinase family protein [Eubacterium sp.]
MQQYCLYLRKSRADAEAEARGEGETLARHERTLLELAKRQQLNVTEIYKEIVSGESLAARPVMQHLLSEVEQGVWAGVLVMEVERLARGDTTDQGIVAQTFKFSGTLIITPSKTYNPDNEFDEEYFEFGLFMSRREYMTINRRLQRGRIASVKEGKFVGNVPPFGYERVKIKGDKGFTLEPVPADADIVRLIFEWYTNGVPQEGGSTRRIGCALIAQRLNAMKSVPRKGGEWSLPTVRDILMNPVYIGMVRWNWRQQVKKMVDGKVKKSRPRSSDFIVCKGLHPAIINKDVFDRAQELLAKNPPRPVPSRKVVQNPLAGLVYCGICGKSMCRRPYQSGYPDTLLCQTLNCTNVSSNLRRVEERILSALREWLEGYKLQWENENFTPAVKQSEVLKKALAKQKTELDTLYKQLSKTHDLLEQGVYNTETFLDRSRSLSERIDEAKENIAKISVQIAQETAREDNVGNVIPRVERLLETYSTLPSAEAKNQMLKEVLEKVVYLKTKRARKKTDSLDDFEITLFPKIPPLP